MPGVILMPRAFLPSLIIYALLLAGLITRNGAVLALSLIFVVYVFIGLLRAPRKIHLEINRELSASRVTGDTPVEVTLTVTNTGPALEEVWIEDNLPPQLALLDGAPGHLLRLPAGETVTWNYTIQGTRGTYSFSQIHTEARETFGLIRTARDYPTSGQLFVLPPVLRIKDILIRPRRTRVYSGIVPARTGGLGVEFFGVREYRPGDSPHWINWRANARHPEKLFSNEFEQERVTEVGIVLDVRMRTNLFTGGYSIFEHSALAAAALADVFLSQGNHVGLLLYGQALQWTLPGYGKMQRERILRALAQAQPGDSQVFADLNYIPTRLFPTHSQIVLVSPLTNDDAEMLLKLRARGYPVMVISPDPVSFEASFLPRQPEVELARRVMRMKRHLMLQGLQRAGIQLLDWEVSQPFDQVMRRGLGRPPFWRQMVRGSS